MFFIDLDKLEIAKAKKFTTITEEIEVDLNQSAVFVASQSREICDKFFSNKQTEPINYNLIITNKTIGEEDFIAIVNVFNAVFFEKLLTNGGRKRERRLDVPANFYDVHISAGLLKKAINTQTKVDKFNLTISCNNLHYHMVDTKGE